jgi:hypothetical protein
MATKKPTTETAQPRAVKDPAAFKLPKSLAECADLLFTTRNARLAIKKLMEAEEAKESALREHLINNLPKSQASGIAGKFARVTVSSKTVVSVTDWDKVNEYILKNGKKNPGVFALYQRRIGDATVKEMWAAGKEVPGTAPLDVPVIGINKL